MFFVYDYITNRAQWLNKKPGNSKSIGYVKWRDRTELLIINLDPDRIIYHVDSKYNIKTPFLKSHLQKCVRRSLHTRTVETTISLLRSYENLDLLRRLMVITGEDCMINPYISSIVWLVSATTKGFELDDKLVGFIIDYAYTLSRYPHQDKRYIKFEVISKFESDNKVEVGDLITTLRYANGYCGLNGDKRMFNKLSQIWSLQKTDCLENRLYYSFSLDHIKLEECKELNPADYLLQATDFHITDVAERIKETYNLNLDEIKSAIWYNISSINNKIYTSLEDIENIPEKISATWKKIKFLYEMEAIKIAII